MTLHAADLQSHTRVVPPAEVVERLGEKLPWHRPECPEVAPEEAAKMRRQIERASWETPSKLSLDEAARACMGPGRYAHQRHVLIEAILDPRLGIAPLPLQLLAAVIECINGGTGVAHPGNRRLAERIVSYLNGIPAEYRYGAIRNAATVVRQAGYLVSGTRAPERGDRAIAHFALACPTPEEKQAAIEAWCRGKHDVTRTMTSAADVTLPMTSPDVTPGMTPGGLMSSLDEGCCHPTGEKKGPTHYTEPGNRNPKKREGADAPVSGTADFDRFWDAFPPGRKVAKGEVRDLFAKITAGKHKTRRASAAVIIAAVERYAATKPDPQYTPAPKTWLNGGRWEDDVGQPSAASRVRRELDAI